MVPWDKLKNFGRDEFPDNVDEHADPQLFFNLQKFRDILACGIHPSPIEGTCVRFDGSTKSRHYAVGRKSDAIDCFVAAPPLKVFQAALTCQLWGGVGVYFDTKFKNKQWTMFHFDTRPMRLAGGVLMMGPTIWYRDSRYFKPLREYDHLVKLYQKLVGRKQ